MYIYACMYIYISILMLNVVTCIYIYTCINTSVSRSTRWPGYMCSYVCMHVYICICLCKGGTQKMFLLQPKKAISWYSKDAFRVAFSDSCPDGSHLTDWVHLSLGGSELLPGKQQRRFLSFSSQAPVSSGSARLWMCLRSTVCTVTCHWWYVYLCIYMLTWIISQIISIHIYMYICICIYVYVSIYMHIYTCMHMNLYIYIYKYICVYICIYICIYMGIYMHWLIQ